MGSIKYRAIGIYNFPLYLKDTLTNQHYWSYKMLTLQQRKARKLGLGGSDIAAICGLSPWKTAVDIYLDKITPVEEETQNELSEQAHFGNLLEEIVAQEYSRRTGFTVHQPDFIITHPKHNFALANIDRWADGGNHILECKTASFMKRSQWGDQGTDSIPEEYLTQAAWYAFVCDKPKVDIAVLIGGQELRIFTYHRDHALEQNLFKIAKKFWEGNVLNRTPPEAVNLQDISKLYPESTDEAVTAEDDIIASIKYLNLLKAEADILEGKIKEQQLKIQNFMGNNSVLLDNKGDILATWKSSKPRSSFDSKTLQKEMPELYEKYITLGKGYRTFLIKTKGNQDV